MKYSTLLRRYAGWGLALAVTVACGTVDNTPPSSYGYPEEAGGTAIQNNAAAPSSSAAPVDTSSSSGSSSGDQSQPSSSGSSGGGQPAGVCPSSCKSNSDCSPCMLPPGNTTSKNCCVMGICVMMSSCPVIRDSGRDGS